jgi:hypothetical protein
MIKQAAHQLQAAERKHIVWLFADRDAAKDVRKKFDENKNKYLKTIEIRIFPSMETIKRMNINIKCTLVCRSNRQTQSG